jgi:putative tricarboxylic transport membrane protein
MVDHIALAFPVIFSLKAFFYIFLGLTIGFVVGALPGLNASNTCALMLPVTVAMNLDVALIFFAAIYCGAQYGGSVPAIMVNAPGEAGSVVTALDGYQMAIKGEPARAVGIARTASSVGGFISGIIVITIIGSISSVVLKFKSVELFFIAIVGLTMISTLITKDARKGFLSAGLGFLVAAMSADPYGGQPRLTFGLLPFYEGLSFIPVLVGLYGVSEMLLLSKSKSLMAEGSRIITQDVLRVLLIEGSWNGIVDTLKRPVAVIRATLVGFGLGLCPGLGNAIANFVSYGVAKSVSRNPEKYGTGCPEGIIASEACDNALCSGTMIPAFTLGIPGSGTTAIILSAFFLHGVIPGPDIMVKQTAVVYSVLLSLIISSVLTLPLGILLSTPLLFIMYLKPRHLVPVVLFFCTIGVYSTNNSMFHVFVMFFFALVGILMRLNDIPIPPFIIALILGPIAEQHFVRAYLLANGDITYFFRSIISKVLIVLIVALLFQRPIRKLIRRGKVTATPL